MLNEAGGRIPVRQVGVLMLTILGYCASDLSIGTLMRRMTGVHPFAPIVATAFTYVLSALLVLPFAFRRRVHTAEAWRTALPFALTWFGAMCLLFGCFAMVGVVFGNIVQSTRGLISIAGGWLLAGMGHTHLWADGFEWRGLRDKQFTYARYLRDGRELLFDHVADPLQKQD